MPPMATVTIKKKGAAETNVVCHCALANSIKRKLSNANKTKVDVVKFNEKSE